MRLLITGGTGFIGRALVNHLPHDKYEIFILTRNPENHRFLFDQDVKLLKWDGKTSQGWGKIVENIDAIINLAGENIAGNSFASIFFQRLTAERKQLLLKSRLDAAKALMQAIHEASHKPSVFIQASAVGFYGDRDDEILKETSSPGNDFTALLCTQWEDSIKELDKYKIRHVIIRTAGLVLSKTGGAFPFLLLPFRFFVGGPLGSGNQWMSWIHIKDEVSAIRFLLETDHATGVFNLCSPHPVINKEFSKSVGNTVHRPSWLPIPEVIFKLLLGDKAKILLASQKQIPQNLIDLGYVFSFPELNSALHNLLINSN